MRITSISIQNFRKLKNCRIDFSNKTTLFVGANNSGKTSAMDALGKFLAGTPFTFNDIILSNRKEINKIGKEWEDPKCLAPEDVVEVDSITPKLDIWLEVSPNEIHYVTNIIPTLKWRGGKLGVRLAFLPRDINKLFEDYREAYFPARKTEAIGLESKNKIEVELFPKNLCDFLERRLLTYFAIRSFILDPEKFDLELDQQTPFGMECLVDNPLKGIVKVDMINAQRGFTDPETPDVHHASGRQLSTQMRRYYDNHLDPEKAPTPEDLEILSVTKNAQGAFGEQLVDKFTPVIKELETLGYPGITDPRITLTTKVKTNEMLKHDSAVQYSLNKNDVSMVLPEKYNGLGYQNLISIIFDLMSFRDGWLRQGKSANNEVIAPLHLVLVEEPEAHLHVQVQQVFIREAYSILTKHSTLPANSHLNTQLIISTHSSHIARETDFSDLRYFKRLAETKDVGVATAKVINLSDVFGKKDETSKFVTRYLQTTHCDLFFADAAIFVEGSAENMLLPHFIRNQYPELYQRYITILNIGGRHSHRLDALIKKLCLPILVITDLDSAKKEKNKNNKLVTKSHKPVRNQELISSNYTIAKWLMKEDKLDKLLDIEEEKKGFVYETPYRYSIRVAYQTPIMMKFGATTESVEAISSTFEDCLVYSNYDLFKSMSIESESSDDTAGLGSLGQKMIDIISTVKSVEELQDGVYEVLRNGKSNEKAEFALDILYSVDPEKLTVPTYIAEGLKWLQDLLRPEGFGNE